MPTANKEAADTLEHSDGILFLVDASQKPQPVDLLLVELVNSLKKKIPVILVLNKSDLVGDPDVLAENTATYLAMVPHAQPVNISAARGENLDLLIDLITGSLKQVIRYFLKIKLRIFTSAI